MAGYDFGDPWNYRVFNRRMQDWEEWYANQGFEGQPDAYTPEPGGMDLMVPSGIFPYEDGHVDRYHPFGLADMRGSGGSEPEDSWSGPTDWRYQPDPWGGYGLEANAEMARYGQGRIEPLETDAEEEAWKSEPFFPPNLEQTYWGRRDQPGIDRFHPYFPGWAPPEGPQRPNGWHMPVGGEYGILANDELAVEGNVDSRHMRDGYGRLPHGFYLDDEDYYIGRLRGARRVERHEMANPWGWHPIVRDDYEDRHSGPGGGGA
ncbi:hypothetical protein BAUCODRAFT_186315 [Baudoinia panamericana UAMH 10762]|uniref:Uncharacterized protein n=1 Tax=Baudoinia panamericana (strain UAMH 10762) TaxID=717646 RepID=M2NMS1_BAUPA|nr:uncharacterized protein BAUCODRAFT_186315 [Baudoinia panamericana UAMH 10762]EMD00835.1 hypothetical protein BAUCODRAFT_186315 [Baudoinia panamericana UAMH 10762]